ncbi:MAG: TolB family protein, partial [Bryobacteraceae bacterium]
VPGLQSWPAFSPDGSQVAFDWTGGTGNFTHIYVKAVGGTIAGGGPVKLTNSEECDSSPSWSRDGRWIAFLRQQPVGGLGVYVVPAGGDAARKVATVNGPTGYRPAWTPGGKGLVVMDSEPPDAPPSLFRVAIDSGDKRRVTIADLSGTGDWCPAYSPNGRMLAYLHNTGSLRLSPLELVRVDAQGMPSALPRMIETGSFGFTSFDWSAGGHSLIASATSGLVRVPLSGGTPEPLPFPSGSEPTVAPRSNRMVYVRPYRDTDIFRVPGPRGFGSVSRLISSTRAESAPQYSADGRSIAFVSDRTGAEEIWVAGSGGQNARQVTSFEGPSVGSPRWSPDGKWIAFDSTASGDAAIYVVAANGGPARKITSADVSCVRPSWSHDGKWIYFGSNQSGEWQIWKTTRQAAASTI